MFGVYSTHIIVMVLLTAARVETEFISNSETEWIDPHDMNINNLKSHSPQAKCEAKPPQECPTTQTYSLAHYKRLINFILNLVKLDDSSVYNGRLNLKMSSPDYKFLLKFVTDTEDIENAALLRKIEQVMNRILTKSKLEYVTEIVITWTDYVYFHFFNRTTAIIASCMFLLVISYKLLKASFTIWSVMKYLIFLAWVTDFAFTWISLLKEAEINQLADTLRYETVSPHCDPRKMSWLQYLMYSISSDSECRKYHQTIYKDIFWDIAPLRVIAYQLGIVVYTPTTHIGKGIGALVSGMMGNNSLLMYIFQYFSHRLPAMGVERYFTTRTVNIYITNNMYNAVVLYEDIVWT
ncbi:hypothetical protein RI129_005708 [Pyrocoelia pectoralis]|uniref:Chloride channel CLIC-like protein 1 n=1 Tax=Pyrocoelia pectoralis TaxID=417401 RepID=A0AAN7ZMF8_9COLE